MRLYSPKGNRLYISEAERVRLLEAAYEAAPMVRLLCLTLLYSGCRISEALELTGASVQADAQLLTFRTLKRRRQDVYREVPIPVELVDMLTAPPNTIAESLIFYDINRSTAYRWVKDVMHRANISGAQACPKGLRHGFGIHAVLSSVPLNLLQKWMGHASMSTTAIYANAIGAEELAIAERMWK